MSWTNSGGDTISGPTGGNDVFTGDDAADLQDGLGGNDTMSGAGGDDSLVGGAGNDVIQGDDGNDTLVGGAGFDSLIGGANDDSITDSGGNGFVLDGGAGNDTIAVTVDGVYAGGPQILGGDGDDSIVASGPGLNNGGFLVAPDILGGTGNDTIIGTDIDDPNYQGDGLYGGTGDDSIIAGGGGDYINLNIGSDSADAGTGDDSIYAMGTVSVDGGAGDDFLDLTRLTDPALSFTVDGAGVLTGSDGSRVVNVEDFTIRTGSGADTFIMGGSNDAILSGGGADLVEGGAGDDLLRGEAGNDTLVGGAGYDNLYGGSNDDSITDSGGDGYFIDGGSGNDTIAVTVDGAWTGIQQISAGEGNDSIVASGVGLDDGSGARIGPALNGDGGNDTIIGSAMDDATHGGDYIYGGSGNDSLIGGQGRDYVSAGDGDDTVVWNIGDGNDIALGGAGTDTLYLEGWSTVPDENAWSVSTVGGATWYTHTASGAVVRAYEFESVVCFAEGTRILTPRGEVPVETLRAGDLVVVVSGSARIQALRWVGHMDIDFAHLRDPAAVAPVLIRAGALGAGVPFRDMRVSPEHGMLLDGRLVPARMLVDGAGIIQETWCRAVTYWHLELDAHGVLVADGALSESYFDDGNRHLFDNPGVVAMRPGFDRAPGSRYAKAACVPPILDAADPALGLIRARLPVLRRTA